MSRESLDPRTPTRPGGSPDPQGRGDGRVEPVEPSEWSFPPPGQADEDGLVAVGGDLEPATIIAAYRQGLFPMPVGRRAGREIMGWWSPHERGVLAPADLVVSRSLRRSFRRYRVTVNAAFDDVIGTCANLERPGAWISPSMMAAYRRLHRMGWAHSVETWSEDRLVGGLYGLQIGGLFAGESMFHLATDASKVALVGLVSAFESRGGSLIDVQWATPHLATLGVRSVTQRDYLTRLSVALASRVPNIAQPDGPDWAEKSAIP